MTPTDYETAAFLRRVYPTAVMGSADVPGHHDAVRRALVEWDPGRRHENGRWVLSPGGHRLVQAAAGEAGP